MSILSYMQKDHRDCDESFSQAETAAAKGDIEEALKAYERFKKETLHHFDVEQEVLFPAYEERTGMTQGPTMVMRMEHEQMRSLLDKMQEALEIDKDLKSFLGVAESMMIMLQQHNMKEEQMLYPAIDATFAGESDLLISEIQAFHA